MRKMICGKSVWSCAALAVASAAPAFAGTISDPAFTVQATSSLGSAVFSVPAAMLEEFPPASGNFRFIQNTPVALMDNGNLIATLDQGVVFYDPSPIPSSIGMNFTITSGDATTSIIVSSAMLDSLAASSASGEASAGMTLTDLGSNGAELTGNGPAGGAYLAQYNGQAPGGTTFLEGITSLSTTGTMVDSVNMPMSPIGGMVADMSAQFAFTMSGSDQVSGTSSYRIIPEPSSLALMGVALLLRRRR